MPRTRRSLAILFTDGVDNASWLTEARVTDAVKRLESVVYAVCPIVDVAEDTWDGRAMRAILTARQNPCGETLVTSTGEVARPGAADVIGMLLDCLFGVREKVGLQPVIDGQLTTNGRTLADIKAVMTCALKVR